MIIVVDGERVEMPDFQGATDAGRSISSAEFLDLWTPEEVAAGMADPQLQFAALGAIAQGAVNLDSPRLAGLLALAVSKGALTQSRAAQIAAGTPPTT